MRYELVFFTILQIPSNILKMFDNNLNGNKHICNNIDSNSFITVFIIFIIFVF